MKILYITTISDTVNAFLSPHIELLLQEGHTVDIACNMFDPFENKEINKKCKIHHINFSRTPINRSNYNAYQVLKEILVDEQYDLVHTRTSVASTIARLACISLKKQKFFYTAHGFHFYSGASLINWLVYYPIEKMLSKYTDTLITINKDDYKRAQKNFSAKRVEYIPGIGINLEKTKKHK